MTEIVPPPPILDQLTPEKAQAMATVMEAVATHIGPMARDLVQELRDEAKERREQVASMAAEQRAHEARQARNGLIFQCVLVAGVAGCGAAAMLTGQWSIAEKVIIALIALGFGRAMR